jgi:4-carboxymuconolactone decarboxylase
MTDTPVDLPADRHERADVMFQRVMGTAPPAGTRESLNHDHVFGDLWSRPNLDVRTRRVVSMVCAAMVGADLPLRSHLAAALRTGDMSIDELREVGLQLGHYGGLPLGVNFAIALQAVEASLEQPG